MPHEQYQKLLQTLHECMTECNHCFDACLKEEDMKMMSECIRLDRECAEICGYLEQAISRGTPFVSELASVCAAVCDACGSECKKHDYDHCQKCAETCFKCAEHCKEVA
ncbi:four-helix bundle copper-binding protein [Bacillus gobiensis]|uniref:four-helix bundle copper-binding protein n=1 Tax=Bacillus gobiensis TaxID=1441095 RepID=UPI003D1D342E